MEAIDIFRTSSLDNEIKLQGPLFVYMERHFRFPTCYQYGFVNGNLLLNKQYSHRWFGMPNHSHGVTVLNSFQIWWKLSKAITVRYIWFNITYILHVGQCYVMFLTSFSDYAVSRFMIFIPTRLSLWDCTSGIVIHNTTNIAMVLLNLP